MCFSAFQVLQDELNKSVGLESGLRSKLDKTREENDELRFQVVKNCIFQVITVFGA